jgi:hypothetical protein
MSIVHTSDAYLYDLPYLPPTTTNDEPDMLVGNSNGERLLGIIIVIR